MKVTSPSGELIVKLEKVLLVAPTKKNSVMGTIDGAPT